VCVCVQCVLSVLYKPIVHACCVERELHVLYVLYECVVRVFVSCMLCMLYECCVLYVCMCMSYMSCMYCV